MFAMSHPFLATLVEAQNPDGGWGAVRGRRSNTEATALAVMALKAAGDPESASNLRLGLDWLATRQNPDGSWPVIDSGSGGSWMTALAILALSQFSGFERQAMSGGQWALEHEGRRYSRLLKLWITITGQKKNLHLNPDLKGWAWSDGAFSWVEPTSYFVLALKKIRPHLEGTRVAERIRQGELLIYDRMCSGGGWNYGNARVLGEALWPYPDVTAIALIALQDHRDSEANQLSARALQGMLERVDSGLALSLGTLSLALYGQDVTKLRARLAAAFQRTRFLGETKTFALSLLAMHDGERLLRV
ncbi:MAG TPA: prenyltransferase/squalene oxidase repeat-containing protein [Candidatus Eisenbacteria bacterium]|nr:prenyltransferase/squalene oxidase repeat-containing protein [Candidatus Eisenbacteria bacterium]